MMAKTKQKTRTREAETAMKTAITQKQSLEAVQTLIHGSLSWLMYRRELLNKQAFDTRYYKAGKFVSYEDYANARLPKSRNSGMDQVARVAILRRNRSTRADKFLDWLERGAFDLLQSGQLQAIQVNVHKEEEDDRDKVMETYTFTIKYQADESGVKSPASVEIIGSDIQQATAGQVNAGLRAILKNISDTCDELPTLPANRRVSTELFCFEDEEVHLDGFVPSTSDKLLFAHAEGWKKETFTRSLGATFLSTNVKVSHLALSDPRSSAQRDHDAEIPATLHYPTVVSRMAELGLSGDEEQVNAVENNQVGAPETNKRTSSVTLDHDRVDRASRGFSARQMPTPYYTSQLAPDLDTRRRASKASVTDFESLSYPPRPPLQDSLDTQSSHVPRMKKALQSMTMPERLTQGDTQTQSINRPVPPTPSHHGRIATPTTVASGLDMDLDLRDSVPRYRTPILRSVHQAKKRSFEDVDVLLGSAGHAASNTAVFKRLKGLRSQESFNANGLPSSPAV